MLWLRDLEQLERIWRFCLWCNFIWVLAAYILCLRQPVYHFLWQHCWELQLIGSVMVIIFVLLEKTFIWSDLWSRSWGAYNLLIVRILLIGVIQLAKFEVYSDYSVWKYRLPCSCRKRWLLFSLGFVFVFREGHGRTDYVDVWAIFEEITCRLRHCCCRCVWCPNFVCRFGLKSNFITFRRKLQLFCNWIKWLFVICNCFFFHTISDIRAKKWFALTGFVQLREIFFNRVSMFFARWLPPVMAPLWGLS